MTMSPDAINAIQQQGFQGNGSFEQFVFKGLILRHVSSTKIVDVAEIVRESLA